MAGTSQQGDNMEDRDEGHTNFEMDVLRRQLQELQQRLEHYENQRRGARHHDSESDNENLMGTKVGLALKILYKFQMGQLQDQEPRRSRKQCKDWYNPLGMKLARAQQSKWV
jgi:hypothetical protein